MSKLYLITGFLGTGKTTFLKNYIQQFPNQRLHLIVNEFGKEGIDGQLLKEWGQTLDEINNGSIFCSCRLDKFEEVLENALKEKPDVILVEASGLSNPTNIKKILSQPGKFIEVDYKGSICLVDAIRFPKVYETATVVKKQIAISDIIILNKVDLASEEQIKAVKDMIGQHRPDLPIHETTYGKIEKDWLEWIKSPELVQEKPEIQNMDITLRSYQIHLQDHCSPYVLQKFIEMFIEDTYRIKGFVELEGKVYLVDCVGNMFLATPYEGKVEKKNVLVVLSGSKLPARKSIKKAMEWYEEYIKEIEWN